MTEGRRTATQCFLTQDAALGVHHRKSGVVADRPDVTQVIRNAFQQSAPSSAACLATRSATATWQKLATAARAVAGGYAGSKVQKRMQEGNTESVVEQRCGTVYDRLKARAGYDVTHLLDGTQGVVRMEHDPGKRIHVEGGELVLTRS